MTEVIATTFSKLSNDPVFHKLLAEYSVESSIDGLPEPNCQVDMYLALEETGAIKILSSHQDGVLTGFLSMIVSEMPHYGAIIAVTESYFVGREHRKTGAGAALLKHAEQFAKQLSAVGMLISTPVGGKLAAVLTSSKAYRPSNLAFFRSLA